jgi:type IV secretory pathway VirB9-like protein
MSENARLYAMYGIATTVAALRPGGTIAYWSVGDDPKFLDALRRSRLTVQTLRVRAHDTAGPTHILYVATRRLRG